MKATVKFKARELVSVCPFCDKITRRQKTIEVEKNEPNHIIREFIKQTGWSQMVYVTTVRCGRTEYQWFDNASKAF